MKTKNLSNMSIIQLENYQKKYVEKKGKIPSEIKQEINFQIIKEKISNKIFTKNLINSKWFKLGIEQTIKKGQTTRILIGENVIYEMDSYDIIINLINLTLKAIPMKNFDFLKKLEKL